MQLGDWNRGCKIHHAESCVGLPALVSTLSGFVPAGFPSSPLGIRVVSSHMAQLDLKSQDSFHPLLRVWGLKSSRKKGSERKLRQRDREREIEWKGQEEEEEEEGGGKMSF